MDKNNIRNIANYFSKLWLKAKGEIKAYTDIEQSRKLAEILPLESADMYYCYGMDIYTKKWEYDTTPTIIDKSNQIDIGDIPCWSLAALLHVLPEHNLQRTDYGNNTEYKIVVAISNNNYASKNYNNPIDACYELIIKLYELKTFDYKILDSV